MLQQRFTNRKGLLFFFDKRFPEKGILATKPKNLFVVGHLYTITDDKGVKDFSLERYLATLENEANRLIERIVVAARNSLLPKLTNDEKAIWDLFFYYQLKRVPDVYDDIDIVNDFENYIQQRLAKFEKKYRPVTAEERTHMQDPLVLARMKQNAKVMAITYPGKEMLGILRNKGLGIAITHKPRKSFVIGSRPIVKLTYPGREHLSDPSVEMWFPIARDVAVTPALPKGEEKLVAIKDFDVRAINASIYEQSTLIAGRSEELIRSLVDPR